MKRTGAGDENSFDNSFMFPNHVWAFMASDWLECKLFLALFIYFPLVLMCNHVYIMFAWNGIEDIEQATSSRRGSIWSTYWNNFLSQLCRAIKKRFSWNFWACYFRSLFCGWKNNHQLFRWVEFIALLLQSASIKLFCLKNFSFSQFRLKAFVSQEFSIC